MFCSEACGQCYWRLGTKYQGCIVVIPSHASLIHRQILPSTLFHFLSLSLFCLSFSSSIFHPLVFSSLLLWINVCWRKISASPQKGLRVGPTCQHLLQLSTGCWMFTNQFLSDTICSYHLLKSSLWNLNFPNWYIFCMHLLCNTCNLLNYKTP